MTFAPWQYFRPERLRRWGKSGLGLWQRMIELLEIPAPEARQWIRRISIMERDIMLPIKAAGIAMIYSFYFTKWIIAVHNELDLEFEAVEYFFGVYVAI